MFSEKEIKAYKSIQAPEELRAKICSIQVGNKNTLRTRMRSYSRVLAMMAACILCVITGAFVLGSRSSLKVSVNGQQVTKDGIMIVSEDHQQGNVAMARTMPVVLSIPFEVEEEVIVKEPKQGVLVQEDADKYCWNLMETDTECSYQLIFQEKGKEYRMILEFNEETDNWEVRLEKGIKK